MKRILQFTSLTIILFSSVLLSAYSQEEQGEYDITEPTDPIVGVMGGVVMSAPRGDFPSLRIGVDTKGGTGAIQVDKSKPVFGYRVGAFGVIGITKQIAIALNAGMMKFGLEYDVTPVVSMQAQTINVGGGVQINLLNDLRSFRRNYGLRQIYLDLGIDLGVSTLANRVEAYSVSLAGARTAMTGSFTDNTPFDMGMALNGGLGIRYALDMHYEFGVDVGYKYALNKVFKKETLPDSEFYIDNIVAQVALGYRF